MTNKLEESDEIIYSGSVFTLSKEPTKQTKQPINQSANQPISQPASQMPT
jgi:hypothetical protein